MIFEPLTYPFFQRALIVGLLASVACGIVGTYVVVNRIASISGGLSHAAFGGVGLGYLIGFDPIVGAMGFTLFSSIGVGWAYHHLRSSLDTMIAMIWAIGMALGVIFISLTPGYAPDLMSYLFGSVLFVTKTHILFVGALDLIIFIVVLALFKELRAISFDEEYAVIMGIPVRGLFHGLLVLIGLAVVTLIQVVGVILVIALLTIPAAIARQWSENLASMMLFASMIGAVCMTAGLFFSYWLSVLFGLNIPSGPMIIVLASGLYGFSSAFWAIRSRKPSRLTSLS